MKSFVLVTVTIAVPATPTKSYSGIKKLKRGTKLHDFIEEYFSQDIIQEQTTGSYEHDQMERADSTMIVHRFVDSVNTYTFTEYKEDDLLLAVKNLTKDELIRDLKELLPLKDWS